MKLLELFSGTKSIGKIFEENGCETVSVDINPKANPDICCDILELDYKSLWKPNDFDVIWTSPPCTEYSAMRNISISKGGRPRNLELANKIVLKTFEIIEYLQPKFWFMENPDSGLLKNQEFMKDIPFVRTDYCKYGYPYRKRTRFWGSVEGLKLQMCKYDCNATDDSGNKHITSIGSHRKEGHNQDRSTLNQRFSIPPDLCREFYNHCINQSNL